MTDAYVYILTNRPQGTLYIGATTDLGQRIYQHKNRFVNSFSYKYNLNTLVYYEHGEEVSGVLSRERQLKRWRRAWKIALIEKENPDWKDLYEGLF